MEVLTQAAQFILSLSILIVLHELGHFIPARLFKIRVEKFYLFFDPWFSLFKVKKGDTEYGIGWLPLGGYVKISGMIDESMDKEQMKLPPQPWEFRSKPAWQRLIIMLGGVTVNVILGMLIYAMVLFTWGEEFLPTKNVKFGVAVDTLGYQMGLRDGDMILSVDNKPVQSINKVPYEVLINKAESIQVERDGQKVEIAVTEDDLSEMIKNKYNLVEPRFPFDVDSVYSEMPAAAAGIKKGDKIIAVNNASTPYYQDVVKILKNNQNLPVTITLLRGNDSIEAKATVTEQGKLGVAAKSLDNYFTLETREYSFFASFPAGVNKAYETFDSYIKQFAVIFTVKDAHKEIGGFMAMGKAYSTTWDWQRFWAFTAFLSIVLAIMNILPIPALDGGHVMFLLYEVITGRKPNEKLMEYAQYAGMLLLLALLLYANGNDVVRLFSK
ncbi:MAG: RIP metalloprotease RseP [Bacteroidota bacterium]